MECAFLQEPTQGKDGSSGKAAAPRSRFESYFMVTVKTMSEQWQYVERNLNTAILINRIGLHPASFIQETPPDRREQPYSLLPNYERPVGCDKTSCQLSSHSLPDQLVFSSNLYTTRTKDGWALLWLGMLRCLAYLHPSS